MDDANMPNLLSIPYDAARFVYTCRRLIDLCLLRIYMPAIDRSLSACRYMEYPDSLGLYNAVRDHSCSEPGVNLA